MKTIIISFLFLSAACATTQQEKIFWVGKTICYQNTEKTLCTISDDPEDGIHLVAGVERSVEVSK